PKSTGMWCVHINLRVRKSSHALMDIFEFITIYGLCYTVSPMKGGTCNGLLTVHRSAVPPHGVPGLDQLDPRRVSVPSSILRGGVPRAYGDVAPRWETPDGSSVYRL